MLLRTFLYGLSLAALALLLQWLDFRFAMRMHAWNFYALCIAVIFVALGIWIGNRLTSLPAVTTPSAPLAPSAPPTIESDSAAPPLEDANSFLGITSREHEILQLLAAGHANKVIAKQLEISPNTVKTHLASLYQKLEVSSRTQAISKARHAGFLS